MPLASLSHPQHTIIKVSRPGSALLCRFNADARIYRSTLQPYKIDDVLWTLKGL